MAQPKIRAPSRLIGRAIVTGAGSVSGAQQPGESANGTLATNVTDNASHTFTLGAARTGGFTTLLNGVAWPSAAAPGGVVIYYYKRPVVYGQANTGAWFLANIIGGTWEPAADPTAAAESLDGTRGSTVTDGANHTFSLGSWRDVPGGAITNNNLVWRKVTFPPLATNAVRVLINRTADARSRVVELEAWDTSSPPVNVALQTRGGVATASSTDTSVAGVDVSASGANNGDRTGAPWGAGGGWLDGSQNQFPDWLQVAFSGIKTISEIDVFSLQDNYQAPITPTPSTTFSTYGLVDFQLQYLEDGIPRPGGLTVLMNGVAWPPGNAKGGVELYYKKPSVYLKDDAGIWYIANITAQTWTTAADPTLQGTGGGATESPDQTQVGPAVGTPNGAVTDRWGNVWSINSVGNLLRNNSTFINAPGSCDALIYFRRTVFIRQTSNTWFQWYWTSLPVLGQTPPLGDLALCGAHPLNWRIYPTGYPTPAANESTNHTLSTTSVTDLYGRTYALGTQVDGAGNRLVLRNGFPLGTNGQGAGYTQGTAGTHLLYLNHNVALKLANGQYFDWNDFDDGGRFDYMTNFDPFLIDDGTVDYEPGQNREGLRGTLTEAQMQSLSDASLIWYGEPTQSELNAHWGVISTISEPAFPNRVTLKTWPTRGGVPAIKIAGRPGRGPGAWDQRRFFASPEPDTWLHVPIYLVPGVSQGMHEAGIKLSGVEGIQPDTSHHPSVRLWMSRPFYSLPRHHRLLIYIFDDHPNPSGDPQHIIIDAFLTEGQYDGLSLHTKYNSFTGSTANFDGVYEVILNGKRVLNITGRRISANPAVTAPAYVTMQVYHGGLGCPYPPPNDPVGDAYAIEYGPHTVARG